MQVFDNDDFPPDAEFGCFQMVNGAPDTDFADEALLKLDVGEASYTHLLSYAWTQFRLALSWIYTFWSMSCMQVSNHTMCVML